MTKHNSICTAHVPSTTELHLFRQVMRFTLNESSVILDYSHSKFGHCKSNWYRHCLVRLKWSLLGLFSWVIWWGTQNQQAQSMDRQNLPKCVHNFFSLSLSLSHGFNGHFPGESGLAGVYRSKGW